MARELLTAHKVRSVSKPGAFKDGAGPRLIVKETKRGELTKRWELWIAINGKKRELGLGAYPKVSLSDARNEADKIRRAARDGIDLRKQRLREKAQACTFREAFNSYFAIKRQQLSNPKHLKQWPRTMETYVFSCATMGSGERATAHGFRSSFKDWCSEVKKVRDDVSEAALAHTVKDCVKAAYLRTDFFEERRSLMDAWARHCQSGRAPSSSRQLQILVADEAA